jgi:transcriptional regulator with XRE-family HTH domain
MIMVDRKRLEILLTGLGLNLSQLAKSCGISRRSLYEMFEGRAIFSTPLEKVLNFLNIGPADILKKRSRLETTLAGAPQNIIKTTLRLQEFAEANNADLFLIGSRAKGKIGNRADWDFAFFFKAKHDHSKFVSFKQDMIDRAFPYKIDIVLLNNAPEWFLSSASEGAVRITGNTPIETIFGNNIERSAA